MAKTYQMFKFCKILMIVSGLWNKEIANKGRLFQILYKVYSKSNQTSYIILKILFVIQLSKIIDVKNLGSAFGSLSRLIFILLVACKMFLCQSPRILRLLDMADQEEKTFDNSKLPEIVAIYKKETRYCQKVIIVLSFCTFVATVFFVGRGLYDVFSLYIIYSREQRANSGKSALWIVLYQIFTPIQSMAFNIVSQALIHSSMVFLKAEFKILQYQISHFDIYSQLEDTRSGMDQQTINYKSMRQFVKKHQDVIRWASQFNSSIMFLVLLEYIVTSMMLATTLIQIVGGVRLMYNTSFLTLCLLQIFTLCWNANEILIESSDELVNALYNSKWYEQNNKTRKLIYLMMLRCRRPVALTIGPFGNLTVDAAVSRVKLAYSFLSLMSTPQN